jgi:dTDP-4-amino-4,6-dideoxygalactose transaminase
MKILYNDFSRQNLQINEAFKNQVDIVAHLKTNHEMESYIGGFEAQYANYCKVKHVIGTNSGTSALQLALFAAGIRKGDEVILPANTYISTALAVSNLGGKPVFCDVNERDYNIDPSKIQEKISEKTRAIIPVHMYGHPARMDQISEIAVKHDLRVVEDAAHSQGAEYKGRKAGTLGDLGCFSFHASKNLGVLGNAGAITTDDPGLYGKIREFRHPDNNKMETITLGRTPWGLDPIHAALLKTKIAFLDKWNEEKRINADFYDKEIDNLIVIKPTSSDSVKHVYREYVLRLENRDGLRDFLSRHGIETAIHYPTPLHLTRTYSYLGYRTGDFPVSEKLNQKVLSIPLFIGIKRGEISEVAECINKF